MRQKWLFCTCLAAVLMMVSPFALATGPENLSSPTDMTAVETETTTIELPDAEEPSEEGPDVEPEKTPDDAESSEEFTVPEEPDEALPGTEDPSGESPAPEGPPEETPYVEELAEKLPNMAEPLEIEAETPVIFVVVPDSGQVIVNPYALNVTLDGVDSTEQIVSRTMLLANHSNIPIQVNASAAAQPAQGSRVVFVTAPPAPNAAGKELFLYLEFQNSANDGTPIEWFEQYRGAENQLLVTAAGSCKEGLLTLDAGDKSPTYGAFRMFGAASGTPSDMWSATDSIQVTVAFTFVPAL